mmetsp:Transcript_27588/g.72925  ORF Transcript_27588/g.72925 Transcript_27588/m.72925 type:complete len:159 (+) Transcript_27588:298-774(+)
MTRNIPCLYLLPRQERGLCVGAACALRAVDRCFAVRVAKCRYCLGPGETLMAAAAKYKTDWMQVWGANPTITDPDDVALYTPLTLGPIYTVRVTDTLQRAADRFGTTSDNILGANPDVNATLQAGTALCVLPAVCLFGPASSAAGAFLDAPTPAVSPL